MIPLPQISILLPVHNAENSLERAVESILQQDYRDWELILIENASTDSSAKICRTFQSSDSRIHHLSYKEKGVAFALNMGLAHARGRYIARMDADDYSFPERLRLQASFLDEHPEIGLVSGQVIYQTNMDRSEGYAAYVDQLNSWNTVDEIRRYRFVESPLAHPSVLFRKELIDRHGLYSQEPIPEDYELWLRWLEAGVNMAKIPQSVLIWQDSPKRLSRTGVHCQPEAFDQVRYAYLAQWLKPRLHALPPIYVWGSGKMAKRKLQVLQNLVPFEVAGFIDLSEKKGNPVPQIHFENVPGPGNQFIISLVSNRGKYKEIEAFLEGRGYRNEKDFILAG